MPKMQIVTDEMLSRASTIGQDTSRILDCQNQITRIFQNMGRGFSGRIPTLMTQHMLAMDKDYKAMNNILTGYKEFLEYSANNYEWTEYELSRWAQSLGNSGTQPGNAGTNSSSDTTTTNTASESSGTNSSDSGSVNTQVTTGYAGGSGPDLNSSYYDKTGNLKTNTKNFPAHSEYNSSNMDHMNCVHYARGRYMEVNNLDGTYPYSINRVIRDPEYVKNGNCVVRLQGHSVYVENYDAATDTVWYSDSNWGTDTDGKIKSKSFDDFINNFKGGFQYAEGIVGTD